METQKPGFLENLWITTKYFRKKTVRLTLTAEARFLCGSPKTLKKAITEKDI